MRQACEVCGLNLSAQDAGDGPAVFVIFFLGLIVVGLAALVEIRYSPPIWVHLMLWTPLILGGAIMMLRPLKAGLIDAEDFLHEEIKPGVAEAGLREPEITTYQVHGHLTQGPVLAATGERSDRSAAL